jgi:RHS repeat-associated protein
MANGLLKQVTRPDGKTVSFTYDAIGRRLSKTFNGTITRWVWDNEVPLHEWTYKEQEQPAVRVNEQGELVYEINAITWIFEADRYVPAAKIANDQVYSIITDHRGAPELVLDAAGKKVWEGVLDIYGRVRTVQGPAGMIPFRFQGQYEDVETGLYYNRCRYYAPEEGVFISQDPAKLRGGLNFYGYVNNPDFWTDIFGLAKIPNKVEGDRREAEVLKQLEEEHPDARIIKERYLRDENGKSIKDPLTDERRRVDFVVIKDEKVIDVVEVTSPTADKTAQFEKEQRIRATGDVYVRDPKNKKLYNVTDVPTRRIDCK